MVITKRIVADKIAAYLQHRLTLDQLVDWAENALMEADFDEKEIDTLRAVIGRLGVAEVRAFAPELIVELDNPNLAVRMQAMEQLIARGGEATVTSAERAVEQGSAWQKAHGLWVLERLGKLTGPTLATAAHDQDRLVRVHALRMVTERSGWSTAEQAGK